jgi:hypothetical protein
VSGAGRGQDFHALAPTSILSALTEPLAHGETKAQGHLAVWSPGPSLCSPDLNFSISACGREEPSPTWRECKASGRQGVRSAQKEASTPASGRFHSRRVTAHTVATPQDRDCVLDAAFQHGTMVRVEKALNGLRGKGVKSA